MRFNFAMQDCLQMAVECMETVLSCLFVKVNVQDKAQRRKAKVKPCLLWYILGNLSFVHMLHSNEKNIYIFKVYYC